MSETTNLPIPQIAKQLDNYVTAVIGNEKLAGFERAYQMSQAIVQLRTMLTDEYMEPIMKLQGSKLGFRTDKDKTGGYPVTVVRECLIEATLMGLQPAGNQWNIIAGNCYPTKEGCGYLLAKVPGLKYSIITGLPRINAEKTSCAFDIKVSWSMSGSEQSETLPKGIKMDAYSSVDSLTGKAERKARAWLLSRITGNEVTDGEVEDTAGNVISSKALPKEENEEENRTLDFVDTTDSLAALESLEKDLKKEPLLFTEKIQTAITEKKKALKK